ncbi:MAG: DUF4388 domain-containing protein [Thermaceae bacterium]
MEGDLRGVPLPDVLELLHTGRRSGVLEVQTEEGLPLSLHLKGGEVTKAAIWDWEGLDALFTFPLHPEGGRFRLRAEPVEGMPLMPLRALLGEWARINDEWTRFRALIDSPSRVLVLAPGEEGTAGGLEVFREGKSVRAAAKSWGVPLVVAMERAWSGVREGDLIPIRRYAWYALRIRYPGRKGETLNEFSQLAGLMDGSRNLGEIIRAGVPISLVRRYLVQALVRGEIRPPGRGWLLRDLLWEMEREPS